MAMLAEPRRKIRYTVNPSGKDWAAQGSEGGGGAGFGQKMLHSMGWRNGEGLGKDSQGNTEPIKVKQKSDQRGVGCSSAYAAETMPQSVDFASVLDQLNAAHSGRDDASSGSSGGAGKDGLEPIECQPAVSSLEAKSRQSRARLHYHKFTRGKDVSAYDGQALACILGSRQSSQLLVGMKRSHSSSCVTAGLDKADEMKQEQLESEIAETEAAPSHGLHLVQSQTSLEDYFRAKMLALKQKRATEQQRQEPEDKDLSQSEKQICGLNEADEERWTSESSCSAVSTPDEGPDDSDAAVVDFTRFPGSEFHRVLGYRLY